MLAGGSNTNACSDITQGTSEANTTKTLWAWKNILNANNFLELCQSWPPRCLNTWRAWCRRGAVDWGTLTTQGIPNTYKPRYCYSEHILNEIIPCCNIKRTGPCCFLSELTERSFRNLFHSIYGGVFRRWSPSTRSQETQSSHIDQLMQNWTRQQLKIRKSESTRLELL